MRCWQQRDCRSLWEKRPGLLCAGHSQFLLAPQDPLQDTAQPLSPAGAISRKTYFIKSKTCHTAKEGHRGKRVRNSKGRTRSEKEEGKEVLQIQSTELLKPMDSPWWSR